MSESPFDLDKAVYTISVASEILETHPRTLMMYEELGLVTPHRTTTNRRRYSQRDIRRLQVIQHLTGSAASTSPASAISSACWRSCTRTTSNPTPR